MATLLQTAGSLHHTIASHPFLQGLSSHQIDTLAACAMPVEFPQGELIFSEGDPANRFYLVLGGSVSIETNAQPPTRIGTVGAGEVLGWSWLFPPYRWHFSARAAEPTSAVFFYGSRLRETLEIDTALGFELMRRSAAIAVERLQATRLALLAHTRSAAGTLSPAG